MGVNSEIKHLKARSIIIDMEEGVINQIMKSDLRELYEPEQILSDVSGSGNNWANGNQHYGPIYRERAMEMLRV